MNIGVGGHSVHRPAESKGAPSERAGRVGACTSSHREGSCLFLHPCPTPIYPAQSSSPGIPPLVSHLCLTTATLELCSQQDLPRTCSFLYTPPAFPGILLLLFGDYPCSQKNSGTFLPQRNKFVHYDGYVLCLILARPWCPDYGVKHSACFFL